MSEAIHSQAPHHLPLFLPGADGSDILFTVVVVMMIVMVFGFGVLYFTLHALPEKIAHGTSSTQFQLIAVLALLAMFTHNNLFWVAALLLATIKLPDFTTPLNAISRTLAEIRDREPAPLEVSVVMPVSQPEPEAPEAAEEPEAAEAPEADQSGEPADA